MTLSILNTFQLMKLWMPISEQHEWQTTYTNSTALAGILMITIIVLILKSRRKVVLADRIPGPRGSFIIGNLRIIAGGPEMLIKNALKEYRIYEKSLHKCWIFNRLLIVLTKPEDIETVFSDPKYVNKCNEYNVLQESIMGQGLFTVCDANKWKNNRKIIKKGLDFALLKSFIPIIFEEANVLAKILQEKRDAKTNDCEVYDPVSMVTMEIIGRTALGVTFNAQRDGRNSFVENLNTIMNTWEYRLLHPWYLNETLYRFSSVKRKHDRSQKIITEYVDEIIKTKTVDLNRRDEMNTETPDDDSCQKNQTIMEILLQNPHGMSYQQIRDEIITILIGGQDTTSMANSSVLLMLALHPDVQDKVYEELQSIFPTDDERDRPPTYGDLQQMKYLERVIKETMRLFPPLPLIGRDLDKETRIGDHLCPAGSTLVVWPMFVQTSPLYYANPDRFDPDNFLPEAVGSRHPNTYIPFSTGLRNCIGIKFAMIQMKTVLSTLVRTLKFSPSERCPTPEHMRLKFMTTLKYVDGCHVRVEPRT